MKRSVAVFIFLVLSLLLSSCSEQGSEVTFGYQDEISRVEGILSEKDMEYGICLYFACDEKGERYCRRAEYSSPESVCGMSFTLEGDSITAEVEGVRISDSLFDRDRVFRASKLFFLREEDIYSIEAKGDDVIIKGRRGEMTFCVTTDKSGAPRSVSYDDSEDKMEFVIKKIIKK